MAARFLISNDDGIYAPGIQALVEAVQGLGELHVVAPSSERSAVGHAITLSDPLKTSQISRNGQVFGHAVEGTPADCVKLAVCALLPARPDFVLSGINLGPNAGISVLYSGTVSAATEGAILGIPSMALSLNTFKNPNWDTAKRVARHLVQKLACRRLPERTLLNVNIPNLPFGELKGYAVTRMGHSRFIEVFEKRADPRGNIYYWMDGNLEVLGDPEQTDLEALEQGYVALTPIGLDLTQYSALPAMEHWIRD